jgi:NADPH2:quinone reductase
MTDKTVLFVAAEGGVGSFATEYAVIAGARVIANVRAPTEERVRSYGVAETIDHATVPLAEAVRQAHSDGIDVLVDLASDAESFASLASLVRQRGEALSMAM